MLIVGVSVTVTVTTESDWEDSGVCVQGVEAEEVESGVVSSSSQSSSSSPLPSVGSSSPQSLSSVVSVVFELEASPVSPP